MMRLFLISLGVTCLASVILFLYFRNRVGRMEQKVDLMFQLIQEYEQTKNIAATRTFEPTPVSRDDVAQMGGNNVHDDLITVSDDDDEDHETDSEEISDNDEEDEPIRIQEAVDNIKSISLSGAEIASMVVEPGDDLDEISDLDDNKDDVITLEETEINEIENLEEDQTSQDETIEEITEEPMMVKKIEVVDEKPLTKMTVKELKLKAEQDGFTNFKGLRKDKLVELLQSH
jgi:hypothetical protein